MRVLKTTALISFSALALMLPISRSGSEEKKGVQPPPRGESQTKAPATAEAVPVYKPPLRGAPGGRVGGGTRGPQREMFVLSVLAPDHMGLTTNEQPSLYWYISNLTSSPVELTIVDPRATQPVLENRIAAPVQPGVHRMNLADHGVRLAPGVPYRWFVAVVADSVHRSKDILAGGTIERIQAPQQLAAKLAKARKTELPFVYADAGLWYDALSAISELIDSSPQDPVLRRQRVALMSQVGLPEIGE